MVFGNTRLSRPVTLRSPSVVPKIGVPSGTRIRGRHSKNERSVSSVIALARPMAEPPPTAINPSGICITRGSDTGRGDRLRHMHHRFRMQAGGLAAKLIDNRLAEPRAGARRCDYQRTPPAEAGRFFSDTRQGTGCKHDTLMRRVVMNFVMPVNASRDQFTSRQMPSDPASDDPRSRTARSGRRPCANIASRTGSRTHRADPTRTPSPSIVV